MRLTGDGERNGDDGRKSKVAVMKCSSMGGVGAQASRWVEALVLVSSKSYKFSNLRCCQLLPRFFHWNSCLSSSIGEFTIHGLRFDLVYIYTSRVGKEIVDLCLYRIKKLADSCTASKVSWFSTLPPPVLVSVPFCWSASQWTMARNPSSISQS
ncbi:hypothetical protein K1719_039506 [Acacia pycnantha]|nr:hypothetical protein K1719_039506 [Acacia pycnantha]